jgi:hypothetical protein
LASRIGTFFFFIGVILVILFIFSDVAGEPAFGYFLIGTLCLFVGGMIWWRSPATPPSEPSERFRTVKKMMKKEKKEK